VFKLTWRLYYYFYFLGNFFIWGFNARNSAIGLPTEGQERCPVGQLGKTVKRANVYLHNSVPKYWNDW